MVVNNMCVETKKARESCKIIKHNEIAAGIFEMVVATTDIPKEAKAGQFVNIYCKSDARLLPRPISICEVDTKEHWLKLVYAVVGNGTKEISKLKVGEEIDVLGPLGNGYSIKEDSKVSLLVGGGVGTPPLVELAKQIKGKKMIYLGFRTEPYLVEELKKYGDVYVATDDGSVGHKGNVIELMNKTRATGDVIYSCGPSPMLSAVKDWANEKGIEAWLSLEERMGCGFGACVGCVFKIKADNENGFTYKKVCKDGPVFDAKEVLF